MTPVRTPAIVRGDVPGLLRRGMPVLRGTDIGIVVEADDLAGREWSVARQCDDAVTGCPGASLTIDWTNPLAIYAALHYLADRGHICGWMLPETHGGRVTEWDGLTAWEVAAVLVSVSVGRVAAGLGPVQAMFLQWQPEEDPATGIHWKREGEPGVEMLWVMPRLGWQMVRFPGPPPFKGPETGDAGKLAADTAALADGCCLQVPGGIVVPT